MKILKGVPNQGQVPKGKSYKMGMGGNTANALIKSSQPLLDGLLQLLEGNTSPSSEPIVNARTMKNMATPYSQFALGGTVDDLDEDELALLQEEADSLGITIEELLAQKQEEEPIDEEEEFYEEDEELEEEEQEDETGILDMLGGDSYAMGGRVPIEAEGEEVMETPDGEVRQLEGAAHEQGGIDMNVPKGTTIYSDRLSVDGKTMADRKLNREKRIAKLDKVIGGSSSMPSKNTLKRTSQIAEIEEQQDMALQEVAKRIYGTPGEAKYGLIDRNKDPEFINPYGDPNIGLDSPYAFQIPETGQMTDPLERQFNTSNTGTVGGQQLNTTPNIPTLKLPTTPSSSMKVKSSLTNPIVPEEVVDGGRMGVGDYVGMAGNVFNAVAPFVNTINAAKNTKPIRNRYKGFGKDALDANEQAQNYLAAEQGRADADVDTTASTSYARNRNSARSVNTVRALDIATDMGKNKAKGANSSAFSRSMAGVLGQKGAITMRKDQMEAAGQTGADIANEQILDNFYTNMGANLTNFGTNVQGIGKSLNKAKSNQDNIDLMALLSQNNIKIARNKKGKLVIANS
jgi:hypothetical protein